MWQWSALQRTQAAAYQISKLFQTLLEEQIDVVAIVCIHDFLPGNR
jgi:hypothetical protein